LKSGSADTTAAAAAAVTAADEQSRWTADVALTSVDVATTAESMAERRG